MNISSNVVNLLTTNRIFKYFAYVSLHLKNIDSLIVTLQDLTPEMKAFVDQYGKATDGKIGIVEVR